MNLYTVHCTVYSVHTREVQRDNGHYMTMETNPLTNESA